MYMWGLRSIPSLQRSNGTRSSPRKSIETRQLVPRITQSDVASNSARQADIGVGRAFCEGRSIFWSEVACAKWFSATCYSLELGELLMSLSWTAL